MFDYRLKVFLSVAENLSFSKASADLHISQPAVTKHIKEIETKLKIRLFERKGNNISLTPAGEILYKKGNDIINIYSDIYYEISSLRKDYSGSLRIGASSTITQWVIPSVIYKFKEAYPHINITLINGNSKQIEDALIENKIDLGIVEGNKKRSGLKYSLFKNDFLSAVVSSKSEYFNYDKIPIELLKKTPLILRENGSGTLDVIISTLNKSHKIKYNELNVLMQIGSTEGIKTYLYESNAMGIVSCCAVKREIETGLLKAIPIESVKFKRQFRFVYQMGGPRGFSEKFMNFAKRHYNL